MIFQIATKYENKFYILKLVKNYLTMKSKNAEIEIPQTFINIQNAERVNAL